MRNYLISLWLLSILIFSGCGYKKGISTGDQEAFLYFSGNTNNVIVSIDNGERFSVKSGRDNQYKIKPGKYTIRVYREGKIIVKREVYIGDGIAKEIGIK
ncbi:hypothetical protein DJ030_17090 [bacterium endosymbiont of Escarpia laminata]|nr:MAG: hypothetical protein DJ030_17090 [bacterium endosymbiont of Escarpia laminata]